jgi:phosphopantothenoylcysteine decarboxylase
MFSISFSLQDLFYRLIMSEGSEKTAVIETNQSKKNLLLLCTGSVACIKVPDLIKKLNETGLFTVRVVATEKSVHFFIPEELPETVTLYRDVDEWSAWQSRGDPVVHIELRKWADIGVIAPLDANTMGKAAGGICDNLVTSVLRAWDFDKPILFCPAMNTHMWLHPVTQDQVRILLDWGYTQIPCVEKQLICGDTGLGAMANIQTIVSTSVKEIGRIRPSKSDPAPLSNCRNDRDLCDKSS